MALVNHAKREINAKIVYYGAGSSGKATNLNYIFRKLKPEHRGKLKLMNIQKDKMLFFDFMPVSKHSYGYNVRYHVYSILGETVQASSWKMVLKGVDGLVFVADSDPARMEANMESMGRLREFIAGNKRSLHEIPLVVQCNKQDLPSAADVEEIKNRLQAGDSQFIPAIAGKGEGVLDSVFSIVKMVQKKLRDEGLDLDKDAEQSDDASGESEYVEAPPANSGMEAVPAVSEVIQEPSIYLESLPDDNWRIPEPIVLLSGNTEQPTGALRLPILVKCGSQEKRFAVTVSLSVHAEQ